MRDLGSIGFFKQFNSTVKNLTMLESKQYSQWTLGGDINVLFRLLVSKSGF